MSKVAIVVVCYNNIEYSKICVDSVLASTDVPFDLHIVDNASTDGTKEWLEETSKSRNIFAYYNETNKGFCGGNNTALRVIKDSADYSHVLLLNNDTIVPHKYLSRMLKVFDKDDRIGVVGPMSNYASGRQMVKGCTIIPTLETVNEFDAKFSKKYSERYFEHGRLIGFCFLMKHELLTTVGLLDEVYDPGMWDDNDFALRSREEGYLSYGVGDVFVYHFGSKTINGVEKSEKANKGYELFHTNKKKFYDKWAKINKLGEHKKIVGMLRVKNGGEVLRKTLEAVSRMVDEIVVFDDKSTDATGTICKSFPKVVDYQYSKFTEMNEARDRQHVFDMAQKRNPEFIYCLAADTKVPLIDGTTKTIKELSAMTDFRNTYVYSVDSTGRRIIPGTILKAWKTGTRKVIKITLDDGSSFKCTPDHPIMLRDGRYRDAGLLRENASLMPLYRRWDQKGLTGYEMLYNPFDNIWNYSHRLFYKFFSGVKKLTRNFVIHHLNFTKTDNSKENLIKMDKIAHIRYHSQSKTETHKANILKANKDPEKRKRISKKLREINGKLPKSVFISRSVNGRLACLSETARKKRSKSVEESWSTLTDAEKSERTKKAWKNKTHEEIHEIHSRGWSSQTVETNKKHSANISEVLKEKYTKNPDLRFSQGKTAVLNFIKQGKSIRPEILEKYGIKLNHKVTKIEECGYEDVYDLTIDTHHNFAIACNNGSGVFVHNCVDHDEIPSESLIRDIQKIVNDPNPEVKLWCFQICHIWNPTMDDGITKERWRKDGLWGGFWQGRLFKVEKNQSIIGKGGVNFHCFPPETRISTINDFIDYKEIKDVVVGDKVVTHTGETRSVITKFEREYSGKLLNLKGFGFNINVTPNHRLLAIRTEKCDVPHNKLKCFKGEKGCRPSCTKKHANKFEWVEARNLGKYDYLVFPNKNFTEQNWLSEDEAYLYGFYLGDGNVCYGPTKGKKVPKYIQFSINIKDEIGQQKVYTACSSFGTPSVYYQPQAGVCRIHISVTKLRQEFLQLLIRSGKSLDKKIDSRIFDLSFDNKRCFLRGLLESDGDVVKKHTARFRSCSYNLAFGTSLLLSSMKITSALKQYSRKVTFKGHSKVYDSMMYDVYLSRKSVDMVYLNKGSGYVPNLIKEYDGKLISPITTITEKSYNGKVYNLEVETDNSYIAGGVVAHNCGSTPPIPLENMKSVPYQIKHYGNDNPALRLKKYLWYTANDNIKDVGNILGGWKDWYTGLYKRLEELQTGVKLESYELKDSDYYRHIVNEYTLQLQDWNDANSISLCMIVKNEEKWLDAAISSVKDLVDEIIIVDTGSTDSTKEIANKYTDNVYDFAWCNDFSAARNFALSKCTKDWVLRLDADEILPADNALAVWNMVQDSRADLIMFPIFNYQENPAEKGNAKYTLSETVRLFKRIQGLEYIGRVHEELDSSVKKLNTERVEPIKIMRSSVPLWHFGYLNSKEYLESKHEYYAELCKAQMKDTPKDYKPYFNLAVHYYHKHRHEEAEILYRKSLELNPTHWMAWNDLGVILYKKAMKKIETELLEVTECYKSAISSIPNESPSIYKDKLKHNIEATSSLLRSLDATDHKCSNNQPESK